MLKRLRHIFMLVILVCSGFTLTAQNMPDNVHVGDTKQYKVDPNPVPGSTYTWSIDGTIQVGKTSNVIDITWNIAGTYLLSVQETPANGCPGPVRSGQVFVDIAAITIVATGHDPITCGANGTIDFAFANVPDGIYTINFDEGTLNGVVVSGGTATVSAPARVYNNLTITVAGNTSPTGVNITILALIPPSQPTILVNKNVSCNGVSDGEIGVTATGGKPNYYYSLDGGATWSSIIYTSPFVISGLSSGSYAVTVKDANGCISPPSTPVTISQPDILAIALTSTNVDCPGGNNGSATATVTGGTAPISYLWSDGQTTATANNLIAGSYTVTVTDSKNCTVVSSAYLVGTTPDLTKPGFTLPDPFAGCVENLISVSYNATTGTVDYNQPDYYTFKRGDTQLDLNTANFTDNCSLSNCTVEIRWRIDFSPATDPVAPHNTVTLPSLSGTGQPSVIADKILFPGDGTGVTYDNVIHHITYWIVDCAGNVSDSQTQTITIKPRPNILNR